MNPCLMRIAATFAIAGTLALGLALAAARHAGMLTCTL